MKIVTRFAPSPTGFLHIGVARTALFNYLFAKKENGKFLLRIDNTDLHRSEEKYIDQIIASLKWLGISWDDEIVFQSNRINRYNEIATQLLQNKQAYLCFSSKEEIENQKIMAKKNKTSFIFKSPWRNKDASQHPKNILPAIRLKTETSGQTRLIDELRGEIIVQNSEIEDPIIIRPDKTPTYILASAVDDYDMQISHIIRGDDHITNTMKQVIIYNLMNWQMPKIIHIPLIFDSDGNKISKRLGAKSILEYKEMGYLPEALRNAMIKLGWGYENEEIINNEKQLTLFNVQGINKSPARFCIKKLNYINKYYISIQNDSQLALDTCLNIEKKYQIKLNKQDQINLNKAMPIIKQRVEKLTQLDQHAVKYITEFCVPYDAKSKSILESLSEDMKTLIIEMIEKMDMSSDTKIQKVIKETAKQKQLKLSEILKPIRSAITGQEETESIFKILAIIGKEVSLKRIKNGFYSNQ